ncbi:MAG: zinc ABC transporter substrate-binding protein [Planctomycetes bacterium]|nr:zinc ABC transporter substrate-binding protein [Planctomycetota bacterium]
MCRTFRVVHSARLLFCIVLASAGCSTSAPTSPPTPNDGKLKILATTGMVADAARQIGGDLVEVTALMGPGVDPHLYQPTARDQVRLKSAQLILYNGLHLEGKMADLFESLSHQKRVVAVTRDIPENRLLAWSDSAGMHDPHVWFDVQLWEIVAQTIARAYAESDPQHASEYESRAAKYVSELQSLDRECRTLAEQLPAEQRVLITSHDAFHYFGRAYGFEVVGIQGISTDSEAGLKAITDAIDLIRNRKIRAIFPETSVPRAAIERVATNSHAKLGIELYSDSLGAPDSPAGTYVGMIRTNMQNIVEALRP